MYSQHLLQTNHPMLPLHSAVLVLHCPARQRSCSTCCMQESALLLTCGDMLDQVKADLHFLQQSLSKPSTPDLLVQDTVGQPTRLSAWLQDHAAKLAAGQQAMSLRMLDRQHQIVTLQKLHEALEQQSKKLVEARWCLLGYLAVNKRRDPNAILLLGGEQAEEAFNAQTNKVPTLHAHLYNQHMQTALQ